MKRRAWLAFLLGVAGMGLGQMYNGQIKKAMAFLSVFWVITMVFFLYIISLPSTRLLNIILGLLTIILPLAAAIEAAFSSKKNGAEFTPKKYNQWYYYVLYAVVLAFGINLPVGEFVKTHMIGAYHIPNVSMENTLMIGDYLIADHTAYHGKRHAVAGDLVIYKYFGTQKKDCMKRCVAGPGQVVATKGTKLFINGNEAVPPRTVKFLRKGTLDYPGTTDFAPLRVPKKGDTIFIDSLPAREFFFLWYLIKQENPGSYLEKPTGDTIRHFWEKNTEAGMTSAQPGSHVKMDFSIFIDGRRIDTATVLIADYSGQPQAFSLPLYKHRFYSGMNQGGYHDSWVWLEMQLNALAAQIAERYPHKKVSIRKELYFDGKPITRYIVKNDNYFMMGDNRDNSYDSRYYGFVNEASLIGKSRFIYLSVDKEVPFYRILKRIRWERVGMPVH